MAARETLAAQSKVNRAQLATMSFLLGVVVIGRASGFWLSESVQARFTL
jgi:hypothetical protein